MSPEVILESVLKSGYNEWKVEKREEGQVWCAAKWCASYLKSNISVFSGYLWAVVSCPYAHSYIWSSVYLILWYRKLSLRIIILPFLSCGTFRKIITEVDSAIFWLHFTVLVQSICLQTTFIFWKMYKLRSVLLRKILLPWSNQGGWYLWEMCHIYYRKEIHMQNFTHRIWREETPWEA